MIGIQQCWYGSLSSKPCMLIPSLTECAQIFFILLLVVSETLYLPAAWPHMSRLQKTTGCVAIVLPYLFLYLAAAGDPGYVTHFNHSDHIGLYPYDFSIFSPGHECRTCRLLKPARSKHCSICKRCVAKMDHHCIFINKCVGYGNHHWFVLLLLSTATLCSYGGILGISILTAKIRGSYPYWQIWKPHNLDFKHYMMLWGWGLQDSVAMGSVTLLAGLISPLVWGLLVYTLWLIYCGTTTNESLKWSDWKAEMDDGCAFKRDMPANRPKNHRIEALYTRWPLEAEQVIIRTDDGKPPDPAALLPGVGEWERVWKLKDVENIYDLGFWNNLKDVFISEASFDSQQSDGLLGRRGTKRR